MSRACDKGDDDLRLAVLAPAPQEAELVVARRGEAPPRRVEGHAPHLVLVLEEGDGRAAQVREREDLIHAGRRLHVLGTPHSHPAVGA